MLTLQHSHHHLQLRDAIYISVLTALGLIILYLGFGAAQTMFSGESILMPGTTSPTLSSVQPSGQDPIFMARISDGTTLLI